MARNFIERTQPQSGAADAAYLVYSRGKPNTCVQGNPFTVSGGGRKGRTTSAPVLGIPSPPFAGMKRGRQSTCDLKDRGQLRARQLVAPLRCLAPIHPLPVPLPGLAEHLNLFPIQPQTSPSQTSFKNFASLCSFLSVSLYYLDLYRATAKQQQLAARPPSGRAI